MSRLDITILCMNISILLLILQNHYLRKRVENLEKVNKNVAEMLENTIRRWSK